MVDWGSFVAWAAGMAAPVLALMLVALRLRRRLVYPHELILAERRAVRADILPRSIRLYADSALDLASALVLALLLASGQTDGKEAVVLDCSGSMLNGTRGDRAVDRAAALVLGEYSRARLFVLGWDKERRRPTLRDASAARDRADSPEDLVRILESAEPFFSVDYGLITRLPKAGYAGITLITDELGPSPAGFSVRELGWTPARALYPVSAAWTDGRAEVRWVAAAGAEPEYLQALGPDGTAFPVDPDAWSIQAEAGGYRLRLRESGAYVLGWRGGSLPFMAPGPPRAVKATGALAERAASALRAAWGSGPEAGHGYGPLVLKEGRAGSAALSFTEADGEPCVLGPALALGQASAVGVSLKATFALGPAALASRETAVAVWAAAGGDAGSYPPDGASQPGRIGNLPGTAALYRVGSGYAASDGRTVLGTLAPPPIEYWRPGSGGVLDAGRTRRPGFWPALALAALYLAKLALAYRRRATQASRGA